MNTASPNFLEAGSPPRGDARVYSVGHSNHEPARFIEMLRAAGVTAVADVRSSPYSQRHPGFNRPELERDLRAAGIRYAFLGVTLGGRPEAPEVYDVEGRVDYERVRATALFHQGLERLLRGRANYRVAMLCGEADPLDCHRGLMIAPALAERGVDVAHLRRDGTVETQAEFEERLVKETGVGSGIVDGLFGNLVTAAERAENLAEAYRRMARKKAFRLNPPSL